MFSKIFELVDSSDYYSKIFGVLPKPNTSGNVNVKCPFHNDMEASLSLNIRNRGGLFFCHGCGEGGNFLSFHLKYKGLPPSEFQAAVNQIAEMFDLDVKSISEAFIDEKVIVEQRNALAQEKKWLNYLETNRGINAETVQRFSLGYECREVNGRLYPRITIPIRNPQGKLENIRRWLPHSERKSPADEAIKLIGMPGFNDNRLFPIDALQGSEIVICEGELDCMLLHQYGYNAITATAGCRNFSKSWYKYFSGKDVLLLLDNDQPGTEASDKLLVGLYPFVRSIKQVSFSPTLTDEDVTDIWRKNKENFKDYLDSLIAGSALFNKPSLTDADAVEVNLYQAAREDLIGKKIKVRALVAGLEDQPYAIPKKVRLTCNEKSVKCPACPGIISDGTLEKPIKPDSAQVLDLLFTGRKSHGPIFRDLFHVFCKTERFEIVEEQNVEEVRLIPHVDTEDSFVSYMIRQAYFIGYQLNYNETYDFTGMTTVDPRTNAVTHVFWKAEKVHGLRDQLNMSEEVEVDGVTASIFDHLRVFQVTTNQTIFAKMNEIYTDLEHNVTKLVNRKDILKAMDITYHSPIAFTLDGEFEPKGWMDTLIVGDTHCGKTRTFKALKSFFHAGDIYDGTRASIVGIIGGYVSLSGSNRTRYVLGVWPLSNGRLICLDEFSGLSRELIGELTSLRSEGIAESTKQGQRNKFQARVRFIALSNPRDFKSMRDFSYGCDAIKELIGEEADISRFDLALTVAGNEVSMSDINTPDKIMVPHIYTSDLCSLMVRWAWSRRATNFQITDRATKRIFEHAQEMSERYDSSIPIVLGQSQRKKIARVAIAIATRTFSTIDGENVIVDVDHVEAAVKLFDEFYSKPSMGYHLYSATRRRGNSLPNPAGVKALLDNASYMVYEFLVSNRTGTLSKQDIVDFSGEHPVKIEKTFSEMIRYRCIVKRGRYFGLTNSFVTFLQNYKHPNADNYADDKPIIGADPEIE